MVRGWCIFLLANELRSYNLPDWILHVYLFWRALISAPIKCHLFSYH